MEQSSELIKKVEVTLEKYRKNKTLVSPEDLKGKYKVPFQKLQAQLTDEIWEFLKTYALEELELIDDEHFEEFTDNVKRIFTEPNLGKRIGKAVSKDFDLEQVKEIAKGLRLKVISEAWVPYFHKHTCLYATEECFSEDNPQAPRFYNSLVDKFLDPKTKKWTTDETAKRPALLIYIQGEKQHEQKQ